MIPNFYCHFQRAASSELYFVYIMNPIPSFPCVYLCKCSSCISGFVFQHRQFKYCQSEKTTIECCLESFKFVTTTILNNDDLFHPKANVENIIVISHITSIY